MKEHDAILFLLISAFFLLVIIIPVSILVVVRRKKEEALPREATENESLNENAETDDSPYSHGAEVSAKPVEEVERSETNPSGVLTGLSLFLYIVACLLPLENGKPFGGLFALTIGIIFVPAWIPNPLFFIGWAISAKGHHKIAILFSLVACVWAIIVASYPVSIFDLDIDGPATTFWVLSMAVLVLSNVFGIVRSEH
ncbi:MAG: hypothetical protein CMJ79_14560 [Planctomycetaceae bacterium]|nr:hypothetical protein [Planctomycetaceae bacterium]